MYSISYYENRMNEAYRRLSVLEEDLEGLKLLKRDVFQGDTLTNKQISDKAVLADKLLNLEKRLPLINSLHEKLTTCFDQRLVSTVEKKYESINNKVDRAIKKVESDIEEQKGIIHNSQNAITVIQEEERIEAARRQEALEKEKQQQTTTSKSRTNMRGSYHY